MTNLPKYVKTYAKCADILSVSEHHVRSYLSKEAAFPTKTQRGYSVAKLMDFDKNRKKAQLSGDGSLRDAKLQAEIRNLDAKYGILMGSLIPIDEYKTHLDGLARLCGQGFDSALAQIKIMTDLEVYEEATRIFEQTRTRMAEGLSNE